MSPLIITAALSLLALDAAPATSPNTTAASAKAKAETAYWNQMICEDRPYVGSRFIRHICVTRAQRWYQWQRAGELERHMGEEVGLPSEGNIIPSN